MVQQTRKKTLMMQEIEQGPIRPPNESRSLILRFTRNCPWNKCTFCPVYKGKKFSLRTLDEIKGDIDAVADCLEHIDNPSSSSDELGKYELVSRHVYNWRRNGTGAVFLQDANSLVMRTAELTDALKYLHRRVPGILRVTTYARSQTVARKNISDLREIREAGLDRVHIGLESGSDRVLARVRKGVTAQQHVEAGRKLVEAGFSLSVYVMPGLGGQDLSREHAVETARVLTAIDPHYIRLRSLRVPATAPMRRDLEEGRFLQLTEDQTVEEIKLILESLGNIHGTLESDHIINLLEEVRGSFPRDRKRMISAIKRYLSLPGKERQLFQLGRRGGAFRSLEQLSNPDLHSRLERARENLLDQFNEPLDIIIKEMGDQYV